MEEISFRGGSRIGWVNASYPFVKLTCSRARLTLSSLGSHEFTPGQVVGFGTFGSIPLLANGLAIEHNRLEVRGALTLVQLVSVPLMIGFSLAHVLGAG